MVKPEWDWKCKECGREIVAPDLEETYICTCGGEMKKVYKPFAFILRGGGFYGGGKV